MRMRLPYISIYIPQTGGASLKGPRLRGAARIPGIRAVRHGASRRGTPLRRAEQGLLCGRIRPRTAPGICGPRIRGAGMRARKKYFVVEKTRDLKIMFDTVPKFGILI